MTQICISNFLIEIYVWPTLIRQYNVVIMSQLSLRNNWLKSSALGKLPITWKKSTEYILNQ